VSFVHDDGAVHLELIVIETLTQEHAISHILYYRLVGRAVFKSDGIPHDAAQFNAHLLRHSLCH
jgi:hypothetical protein